MIEQAAQLRSRGLARSEARDVLRYWLSALRLEEALAARPRAQRVRHELRTPRLDQPLAGQEYFKQPLDPDLARLLDEGSSVTRALDGELVAFFEHWLYSQYRRGDDDGESTHLLCFPVLQLARGELAGLLRAPLGLHFEGASGQTFRVPSRRDRARQVFPEPPVRVRIARAERREGALPLFVDTRLLHATLGVPAERIDALFEALRAREPLGERDMVQHVVALLEQELGLAEAPSDDLAELLTRITRAVRLLLQRQRSRSEVYGIGIVLDGAQAKTTWHLQRELTGLIEEEPGPALDTPLGAYLSGRALAQGEGVQRAQFFGAPLTDSQRAAAEQFWGSPLSTVQGPPGTGKTTLILHLCAEALLRNVEPLLSGGTPGEALLVVASSNNRAVDNVLEPLALAGEDTLPLGLRAGSRQVVEQVLCPALRRTAAWLARAELVPVAQRAAQLSASLAELAALRAQLTELLAPRAEAFARERERAEVARTLAQLSVPDAPLDPALQPLSEVQLAALASASLAVETRLLVLSRLCEATPGPAQLRAVASQYGRMAKQALPALAQALGETGLSLILPLPPALAPERDAEALLEAWEEATEQSLAQLSALRTRLTARAAHDAYQRAHERLSAQLAACGAPQAACTLPELGTLPLALFRAVLQAREAWAASEAGALREAVQVALRGAESERSLRPFFRDEPNHARRLRQLFPLWGSTLLSLGNCFAAESVLAQVILDEAGQCHPAHAVSALLRGKRALVLGDVHQLTPVFELAPDDDERALRSARLAIAPELLAPYRVHTQSHASSQSLAERAVSERRQLVDHFRCQPEIIAVSDALCGYGLKVHTPLRSRREQANFLTHPMHLTSVEGVQELLGGSYCNRAELTLLVGLIDALLRAGIEPWELAAITPYRGQLDVLRAALRERGLPVERSAELADGELSLPVAARGIALGTVHRFQGGERSIVLFSSVVSERRSLPFLDARPNLLNVAVSRAREHFVCIGRPELLAQGVHTQALVQAARPLLPAAFMAPGM